MSFWSALKKDVGVFLGVSAKVEKDAAEVLTPIAPGLAALLTTVSNASIAIEGVEQGLGLSGTGTQKAAIVVEQVEGVYNTYLTSLGLPAVPGAAQVFVDDFVALLNKNFTGTPAPPAA